MANKSLTNNNLKNVMLDALGNILDTLVALDGTKTVRSNEIDSNFGTASNGVLALDQTVNSGNRSLTIPENTIGQNTIDHLLLKTELEPENQLELLLPQSEAFEYGGEFIVEKLEVALTDKEVIV